MRMFHCVLFCGIATLALQAPVTAAARAPLPLRFEPNVGKPTHGFVSWDVAKLERSF